MQQALRDGEIDPGRVDYVNAHGTGTEGNDPTETESIHRALGERVREVWVSSTKSMHGHLLGGAAALEAVATVLAIRHGIVPPTVNFTTPGEGCDLDYVPNTARERALRVALCNSFAFGGLNAVLAFGAV
jgi:3-oxoacyl-(acyl-carrier-protein) synthase